MTERGKVHQRVRKENLNESGEAQFYAALFNSLEISDLDALLDSGSLLNEISMLRVVIRRLFAMAADKAEDLDSWRQVVATLGSACARLVDLIQAERRLHDGKADTMEAMSQALAEVLEELGI